MNTKGRNFLPKSWCCLDGQVIVWTIQRNVYTTVRQTATHSLHSCYSLQKNNCYCAVKSSQNKAISNNPSTYRNTLKRVNISNSRRFVFRHMLAYITLQLPYHKYTSSALHKSSMIDITSNNRQTCRSLHHIIFVCGNSKIIANLLTKSSNTVFFDAQRHPGAVYVVVDCPSVTTRYCIVTSRRLMETVLGMELFLPRDAMHPRYKPWPCVCPSVCLSVTSRRSTKTAKRITQTTPHDSSGTLVFWSQRSPRNSTGINPARAPNAGGVGQNRRLSTNNRLYLKNGTR